MEWIKCSERLPNDDEDVLIYDYRDGIGIGFYEYSNVSGYYEKDGSFFITNSGWEVSYDWARHMDPTHWMPLPKPPKED